MFVDDRHLVVTQTVDVIFLEKRLPVVDQKLTHLLLPEREDQSAGVSVAQEVLTVRVVEASRAIEEIQTLVDVR